MADKRVWWVDDDCIVCGGQEISSSDGKTVVYHGDGYQILPSNRLHLSWASACREAISKLTELQADTAGQVMTITARITTQLIHLIQAEKQ